MKTHKIIIDQTGGIKVDATGFVGKACEETTNKLLAGLGAAKVAEAKKPEYTQIAKQGETAKAQRW